MTEAQAIDFSAYKDHEEKRRLILLAAARLFTERGFHEVHIDEISRALGVSKPTVYYYVKNKEDILYQIMVAALSEVEEKLSVEIDIAMSGLTQLKVFVLNYAALVVEPFASCLSLVNDRVLNAGARTEIRGMMKRVETHMSAIVDRGVEDGSIRVRNRRMFVMALFGALNWMPRWFSQGGQLTASEVAEEILLIFKDHLASQGGQTVEPDLKAGHS